MKWQLFSKNIFSDLNLICNNVISESYNLVSPFSLPHLYHVAERNIVQTELFMSFIIILNMV